MDAVYGSPGDYYNDQEYEQLRSANIQSYSPITPGEGVSPMRQFMEQTVKHRQDRLREEEQLQFSETKARQLQRLAMTHTAMKTFQEQLDRHQTANVVPYVPYFLDVPCYQQQIYRDYVIDYASYLRRVSKYDLDRGTLDF